MKDYNEMVKNVLNRRDKYVAEKRKQTKRLVTSISCFCLCALIGVGIWQKDIANGDRQNILQKEQTEKEGLYSDLYAKLPTPNFNSATLSINVTNEIALLMDDFVPLTYEELLEYYGVNIAVEDLFPNVLSRIEVEQGGYGIYRGSTRGVYYDKNNITFENEDKTTTVGLSFSKVAHRPGFFIPIDDTELNFTEINGRKIVVFQYIDDTGNIHYYSEFLQNGIGWYVGATGMNESDFLRILMNVVSPVKYEMEQNVISGNVVAIDTYARKIGIMVEEQDITYIVNLLDGVSMNEYNLSDRVSLTYNGEPALIQNIWAQQIIEIKIVE